jgi:ATP-dependent helicase/DNAse subunit B
MYGPDHVWSAGRLEAYATCPFVFLLERVLGLAAVKQAEEETSALTFGGVAHDVLEGFYRRVGETPPAELDARAGELLRDVLQEVRSSREVDGGWLGLPVLWRQTFRRIGEAVREYLEEDYE